MYSIYVKKIISFHKVLSYVWFEPLKPLILFDNLRYWFLFCVEINVAFDVIFNQLNKIKTFQKCQLLLNQILYHQSFIYEYNISWMEEYEVRRRNTHTQRREREKERDREREREIENSNTISYVFVFLMYL